MTKLGDKQRGCVAGIINILCLTTTSFIGVSCLLLSVLLVTDSMGKSISKLQSQQSNSER
jgi:hypothetical protein